MPAEDHVILISTPFDGMAGRPASQLVLPQSTTPLNPQSRIINPNTGNIFINQQQTCYAGNKCICQQFVLWQLLIHTLAITSYTRAVNSYPRNIFKPLTPAVCAAIVSTPSTSQPVAHKQDQLYTRVSCGILIQPSTPSKIMSKQMLEQLTGTNNQ